MEGRTKMRMEAPVCRKCCCCLPLRYGLLVWAYYKMVIAGLLSCFILVCLYDVLVLFIKTNILVVELIVFSGLLCILIMDIIFTLIFIAVTHKFLTRTRTRRLGTKEVRLLRIYFIYNMMLWVIIATIGTTCAGYIVLSCCWEQVNIIRLIAMASIWLLFIVVQTYYLMLIRSEMIKRNYVGNIYLMKNEAEAVYTLAFEKDLTVENAEKNRIVKENEVEDDEIRICDKIDGDCFKTCCKAVVDCEM